MSGWCAGAANSFFRQYNADAGAADPGPQAQAVANWINSHGGVGGSRVSLRMRHYDFYRERLSVLDAATCDAFGSGRQDDRGRRPSRVGRHDPCLAKRDIPTFVNTQSSPAKGDFDRYPSHLYSTASPALDRPQAAYVRGLKRPASSPAARRSGC